MKRKIVNGLLAIAVAISTLAGSVMPAMAAEVELQGDSSTTKTQSVEVSATLTSVYCVSLPATLNLEYRTVTNSNGDDTRTNSGYFCDLTIGAAGKLISTQTLRASFLQQEVDGKWTNCIYGQSTNQRIEMQVVTPGHSDSEVFDSTSSDNFASFERFNSYFNKNQKWNSTEIGSCDYEGSVLSNCDFTERTFVIGFDESSIPEADEYVGNITVNFEVVDN